MKIISGGQSGVDRAALDAAIECNIAHGGWCPKGRLAEDGTIAAHYQLRETKSKDYAVRTKRNIEEADGTLILVPKLPLSVTDGTVLTIAEVKTQATPYLIINLSQDVNVDAIVEWVTQSKISTLNIAGPRESQAPGIYQSSKEMLLGLFQHYCRPNSTPRSSH